MIKQFQKIKISILFFMIIGSSFITICSIAKSNPLDPIYECTPNIVIEYDRSLLRDPIIPYGETRLIPVNIRLQLIGPAVDIILGKIGGKVKFIVDMSIAEVPEGCHASVTPKILLIELPKENMVVRANATISIAINQFLPASSQKNVAIGMVSRRVGGSTTLIKTGNFTQDIPFTVGYYSQLSFNYIDGNVRNISPDETANFNFEISNYGNGATKVISEVQDLPDGWITEIVHSTILGSELIGSPSNKSISLRVKAPTDFGYHEDRAIIKVQMTPVNYQFPEYQGEPHYLYFIVQSKGFFTPGFDIVVLFFALLLIIIPVWKRKNNDKDNDMGGKR
jgi:hypothetical protein